MAGKTWAWEARSLRWLTLLWLAAGLVMLFSASYFRASVELGDGLYYIKRQTIWAIVGLIGFAIAVRMPLRYLLGLSRGGLWVLLGLLWLILIPGMGTSANGATRWISIGLVSIQPSELIKPLLVLEGAKLFGRWNRQQWRDRLPQIGLFAAVLFGILMQPNLSTAALCGLTLWLMALAAGLPFPLLGGTAIGGTLLAATSLGINEYQRRRVLSFLNPAANPDGDGYQLLQSLFAVRSGGLLGEGFGLSERKLAALPIQHSDFIFAVFAEEFGFVGGILLLLLLAAYATLALRVALKTPHPVHQSIAIGAMVLLVGQASINMGVAIGVLPTTGLPFPLFSYGGSSIIASLVSAGLLVRVARESSSANVVPFARKRRSGDEKMKPFSSS